MKTTEKLVKNKNEINVVDVINSIVEQQNDLFLKNFKKATPSEKVIEVSKKEKQNALFEAFYYLDKEDFIEKVLKQINGDHAYKYTPRENLTCTYGTLYLPVVDTKTKTVKIEKHQAIYYTSTDDRLAKLREDNMYTFDEAKSLYEYALREMHANKMVLLREKNDIIDVTPLKEKEKFSYATLTYDKYPLYALDIVRRQHAIVYGITDHIANKIIMEKVEKEGYQIELTPKKQFLKNVKKVFKRSEKNCFEEEQRLYKVKVVDKNHPKPRNFFQKLTDYVKRSNKTKSDSSKVDGK